MNVWREQYFEKRRTQKFAKHRGAAKFLRYADKFRKPKASDDYNVQSLKGGKFKFQTNFLDKFATHFAKFRGKNSEHFVFSST